MLRLKCAVPFCRLCFSFPLFEAVLGGLSAVVVPLVALTGIWINICKAWSSSASFNLFWPSVSLVTVHPLKGGN